MNKIWFIEFAYLCGIKTLTMASFFLPMWSLNIWTKLKDAQDLEEKYL